MGIPFKTRYWRRIEGGWYRLDGVHCRLSCAYCITGQRHRQRAAGPKRDGLLARLLGRRTPRELPQAPVPLNEAAILSELRDILAATPANEALHLTADDLLETGPLFLKILDLYREFGRHMDLVTPGLRLADLEFARAVSGYDLQFTLTYLAHSPENYERLTDNPQAHAQVQAALRNLKTLGIPFGVNVVLTSANVSELSAIARYLYEDLGLGGFTLLNFYLEQCLLDVYKGAAELFAPFAELDGQLAQIAPMAQRLGRSLTLVDVPPCQLRKALILHPALDFTFVHQVGYDTDYPSDYTRDAACAACPLDASCPHISTNYLKAHPETRFDAAKIAVCWPLR